MGLKLVDLALKEASLKAGWPIKWKGRKCSELDWFYTQLPVQDKRIWFCNTSIKDIETMVKQKKHVPISFYIWGAWSKIHYQQDIDSLESILDSMGKFLDM